MLHFWPGALRASKRHPVIISELTIVRASDPIKGGVSLAVPFGGRGND